MLFGIPLIYTMEVWWVGATVGPLRMLVVLAVTFLVLVVLNHTGGFRESKDVRIADALRDSVEALAIALVSVFVVLVLLREIDGGTALREGLGKVVYEATPFAFGVGLARHFLRKGRTEGDDDGDGEGRSMNPTVVDLGATLLGSVFVAFNIAPTDEVPMIAAAVSPIWQAVLVVATLVISYCIVFEAGFSDQKKRRQQAGLIQDPLTETAVCYLVALVASGAMLVFFDRLQLDQPLFDVLGQVVVLGLPAAVGGAAGRLAT
jgi:putative integral membrane protein (TIGR02587 family)